VHIKVSCTRVWLIACNTVCALPAGVCHVLLTLSAFLQMSIETLGLPSVMVTQCFGAFNNVCIGSLESPALVHSPLCLWLARACQKC
jgi:hypothetical protein